MAEPGALRDGSALLAHGAARGFAAERALASSAAREAGRLALQLRAAGASPRAKPGGEPVSEADLAVDSFLKGRLCAARPGFGWLSEESAGWPGGPALWVVDPIDGTRDFLRGRPGWAVSVALVVDGEPMVAALEAPDLSLSFLAERGRGAWCNGVPIAVSGRSPADAEPVRLPLEPHVPASPLWGPGPAVRCVARPGSMALRMAMVADGSADAMIDGRTSRVWDVAAATLLVAEAGGRVTGRDGSPLRLGGPDIRVPGIVAATPAWHGPMQGQLEAVLARLASAGRGAARRQAGG